MPSALFLLDVMPLLYRGYFAFLNNPRRTSAGLNVSSLFSFTSTVAQILEKSAPSHLALVFDSTTPTFRHEAFKEYKAKRDKLPEDIAAAIPMAAEFAAAMRIPSLRVDGFEADDLLGSGAALATAAGIKTFLVTPDKDIAQLVRDGVTLYRLSPGGAPELMGPAEVCSHWGISSPAQMIDWLSLAGDASDNIPGVPGVGDKTAQKLLAQYGDLEGILAAAQAGKIAGKLGEKLVAGAETARLSRFLATIRQDVPLGLDLDAMRVQEPDRDALAAFCAKYELASLARRFGVASASQPPPNPDGQTLFVQNGSGATEATALDSEPSPASPPAAVIREAATTAELSELVTALKAAPIFAFAAEATSNDPATAELTGLTFATSPDEVWHVAFQESLDLFGNVQDSDQRRAIAPILASGAEKVTHDSKFHRALLERFGMPVTSPCHDTMLMHFALDAAARHTLESALAASQPQQSLDGKTAFGQRGPGAAEAPASAILYLYSTLKPQIEAAGLERAISESEEPLVEVLLDIERAGVKIDAIALRDFGRELAARIAALQEGIFAAAGEPFNLGSPKQLGEILFSRLAIDPKAKRTSSGQFATGEEVLLKYAPQHQIVRDILDWRAAEKLRSTYAEKLPSFVSPADGRIHTRLAQAFTETGRLSSSEPNLQNIPVRTEMGKRIRAAFVARDDAHTLVSADYSQVELRVMAALSGDEAMIAAFRSGRDIHAETASRVFGVALEDVTPRQRSQCKAINFGIIYGMSAFGLAQRLEIGRQEAASFIEEYFKHYPGVKRYMEKSVADAREKGYAVTILGRRRALPEINSRNAATRQVAERNAINTPVQGSAADLMKLAMVKVWRALKAEKLETKIILQIHDELLLDAPKAEEARVREIVAREMTGAYDFGVPLVVEIGSGPNWLAAH